MPKVSKDNLNSVINVTHWVILY